MRKELNDSEINTLTPFLKRNDVPCTDEMRYLILYGYIPKEHKKYKDLNDYLFNERYMLLESLPIDKSLEWILSYGCFDKVSTRITWSNWIRRACYDKSLFEKNFESILEYLLKEKYVYARLNFIELFSKHPESLKRYVNTFCDSMGLEFCFEWLCDLGEVEYVRNFTKSSNSKKNTSALAVLSKKKLISMDYVGLIESFIKSNNMRSRSYALNEIIINLTNLTNEQKKYCFIKLKEWLLYKERSERIGERLINFFGDSLTVDDYVKIFKRQSSDKIKHTIISKHLARSYRGLKEIQDFVLSKEDTGFEYVIEDALERFPKSIDFITGEI